LLDFNKILIFSTDFKKLLNTKFQANPSSGSRVVQCGRTNGRPDMAMLTVAFRNSADAPKNRDIDF